MVLFLVQAPMGYIHHVNFVATGARGFWSYAHIWNGRIVMLLGIVNGGLGLDLAGIKHQTLGITVGKVDKKWVIAYAVVAGIVGLLYVGGLVGKALMGGNVKGEKGSKNGVAPHDYELASPRPQYA